MIKKLLWIGFVGSILSLICDFLLGWMVYPEASNHYIGMIASCAELSYLRLGLSALFGGIGIPMQYFGFKAIAEIVGKGTNKSAGLYRKLIHAGAISTAALGGSVHILCVALMLIIRVECNNGFDPLEAATLLESIPESALQFALWGILPFTIIMMTPYMIASLVMFWAIFKKFTYLPRWMCVLNPLAAKIILNAVAVVAPNSAVSNGLGMANMALGGMIPFLGILIWMYKDKKVSSF
ncbi:MAG: hypothetical protein IJ374_07875 [Lachnospiraceae bacterium]|nr:hypothetical protein [Lachnospiraceae bacterium]